MTGPDGPIWTEALRNVPGAQGVELTITALAGGTTNATFRVHTGQGDFVVRLHEPYAAELGVDRRREALLHAVAARAGLASRILAADPHGRFLVTEFLTAAPWQVAQLEDESCLGELARTLGALQALPAPAVTPLPLLSLLESHVAYLTARDPQAGATWRGRVERARQILRDQERAGRPACIVHGDPAVSNLIGAGPLRLIDWEYATVGDPLTDLACLLAYYPQLAPHAGLLLTGTGLARSATPEALAQLASVYRLASDLWYERLALARRHPPPAH